ncbi:50S ribosomal protein L25 [Corynebacterium yudongzhengii]|uniref:Large ribosomal subunit protein bL25 n=1 Tax=Corynebacterium yudongzhengii TaxID=2080740 RepID=A0A2U1T6T2_9CORY|nr:50S ribosomal protein L25/general stress protein Ctc [Corynebacterium yudongzhengii]AWB82257.1 50S ribosomal protein L25 [Corynebacterium yudongzhengii]PWC01706.1 50S ribosomal protein L25/general stress protein Ctc [Corynebacterium yudongzhengii]
MAETPVIKGEVRKEFGKGAARRLRRDWRLPGVLYGEGHDNYHFHVDLLEMQTLIRYEGVNAVMELELEGQQHLCMVRHIDQNILTLDIDHIDLLTVKRGQKVEVEVPVVTEGEIAPGGQLLQETDNVLVLVDPLKIPDEIVINVEGMEIGTQIFSSDLPLPDGVSLVNDEEDDLFVNITEPEEAEVPEEGDEAPETDGEDAPAGQEPDAVDEGSKNDSDTE